MDGLVLALFLISLFFGGIVSGLAGFAMGLVVSGIWLHILTPAQTAALIVGYGLLVQSYSIWKLRHALRWHAVTPFIAGGAIGVPLGLAAGFLGGFVDGFISRFTDAMLACPFLILAIALAAFLAPA